MSGQAEETKDDHRSQSHNFLSIQAPFPPSRSDRVLCCTCIIGIYQQINVRKNHPFLDLGLGTRRSCFFEEQILIQIIQQRVQPGGIQSRPQVHGSGFNHKRRPRIRSGGLAISGPHRRVECGLKGLPGLTCMVVKQARHIRVQGNGGSHADIITVKSQCCQDATTLI